MDIEIPKHGGPQSWNDLRRGLIVRKEIIRRRNIQIKSLKHIIDKQRDEIELLKKGIDEISLNLRVLLAENVLKDGQK